MFLYICIAQGHPTSGLQGSPRGSGGVAAVNIAFFPHCQIPQTLCGRLGPGLLPHSLQLDQDWAMPLCPPYCPMAESELGHAPFPPVGLGLGWVKAPFSLPPLSPWGRVKPSFLLWGWAAPTTTPHSQMEYCCDHPESLIRNTGQFWPAESLYTPHLTHWPKRLSTTRIVHKITEHVLS